LRIQVKFIKQGSLRFISHHNLMKLFERAIRRASISVKMSEGYNPRPKIAYPLALPVGIKGIDEKLEMELCEQMDVSELETRLKKQLPENMQITSVEPISRGKIYGKRRNLRSDTKKWQNARGRDNRRTFIQK